MARHLKPGHPYNINLYPIHVGEMKGLVEGVTSPIIDGEPYYEITFLAQTLVSPELMRREYRLTPLGRHERF